MTFLPLAGAGYPAGVVAVALLVQPAAATIARWAAGRLGDRYGQRRLLGPGLALTAVGTAGLALLPLPSAVLFGVGFGLLQNATLALMYDSAPRGSEDTVSAVWNIAYDLGMAAGALAAGLLVAPLGVRTVFILTAAATLPIFALLPRRS